jgi:antitoxin (DNA-binding transcriptional repressor) of toxin-antitoxin stability system
MKTLDLASTGRLAEELESGETIELVEAGKTVARVVPVHEPAIPRGTVPDWFFNEAPPKFPGSVLEQLLHDRHSRDW